MMASKSKSVLYEASNRKTRPATPSASKLGRVGSTKSDSNSHSPQQKLRSAKSVDSKPSIDSRLPKITTPPDKQSRTLKGLPELQAQLDSVQEDLKKANEQLAAAEIEKACATDELKDAKRLADEANEKLTETLLAQKRAEEKLEIQKFRADELEQGSIEAAQKKEEEHVKELESIRNQHASDIAALVTAREELQKVRHELHMDTEAKNAALSHADDIAKIAKGKTEKVELLSAEVTRLKALLDSKMEGMSSEASELVKKLNSEVEDLKNELEKKKDAEQKLVEIGAITEGLRIELSKAKKAETRSNDLMKKWKRKVELLEVQVEEASQSEKSSLVSLASVRNQLEESNALLQEAESKMSALNGKVACLEIEVDLNKADIKESDRRLDAARQEAVEFAKTLEVLKAELQTAEEAKSQAMDNENVAASAVESLSEERKKLMSELEITKDQAEKANKAMEDLVSALHEVSTEATNTQERLLMNQAEIEDARLQIEVLRSALKNTKESYELTLDEAKYEIVCLKKAIERGEMETKSLREEWEAKEINLVGAIKRCEEELARLKEETAKAAVSLKVAEDGKQAAKDGVFEITNKLSVAESEVNNAGEAVENVKAETLQFKERLLDKENELQSITQENDELRSNEAAALDKIKELSALLADATSKKLEQNGKPAHCEKSTQDPKTNEQNGNGNQNDYGEDPVEMEVKMWESHKLVGKTFSMEREHDAESIDDEQDSKLDIGSFDQTNGALLENGSVFPSKLQPQKKKKAFIHKFGGLLKKKSEQKQ